MRFDIVTIFPGFFTGFLENGILRRALADGLDEIAVLDLRNFTHDRHRTVDDRPFGGGEGMVLKPQPIAEALASLGIKARFAPPFADPQTPALYPGTTSVVPTPTTDEGGALAPAEPSAETKGTSFGPYIRPAEKDGASAPEGIETQTQSARPRVILLSAQGRPFTQSLAREIAALDHVVLICGRYEGVDERINQLYCDMELSIGDYVLSGGELAAAVVIDAAMRLIPGVLGNEASSEFESFGIADTEITSGEEGVPRSQHGAGGLLDYPHYTRPAEFQGLPVPETLLNGDHQAIRRWRREQQLRRTFENRPDLIEKAELSREDQRLLDLIRSEDEIA
jgi:tRNA (guanine37-N1)-methyltransferase